MIRATNKFQNAESANESSFAARLAGRTEGSFAIESVQSIMHEADANDSRSRPGLISTLSRSFPQTQNGADRVRADLRRAGFRRPTAFDKLAAIRYVGMMTTLVGFGTGLLLVPRSWEAWCVGGLALAMASSWCLPVLYLRIRAQNRTTQINRELPNASSLIDLCLRQGMTVSASIEIVSQELQTVFPELAQELAIIVGQASLGGLDEALREFADVFDSEAIRSFAKRTRDADRFGTYLEAI